ncbi:MAG: TRAM domain-containing protein [Sedimentisphaerales bacterium]|nr:TRAM domain-containing protein [Sedimentisphaerales bacterium]
MVFWVIRLLYFLLIIAILLFGFRDGGPFAFRQADSLDEHITMAVVGCLAVLLLGLAIDMLVPRKNIAALAGIFFGLIAGLIIGLALNFVIDFFYEIYGITESTKPDLYIARNGIKLLVNLFCCYLAITWVMQTKDDFRFIIPYVEFSKQTKGNCPLLLDTSVIIDGRIADIASTKVITSPMVIPRFVLNELQNIADSSDRLRRNRGRRGLDVLNKMQSNPDIDLTIQDISLISKEAAEPVDHKLVSAALKVAGKVVTNDYNLNKVASIRGVDVININDLANAMKSVLLPGELMQVKVVKPGDQPGQGVGYMDDGTMVVIEQGRDFLHRDVEVVVTSVLQTSAGRMIFGKVENDSISHNH